VCLALGLSSHHSLREHALNVSVHAPAAAEAGPVPVAPNLPPVAALLQRGGVKPERPLQARARPAGARPAGARAEGRAAVRAAQHA
jgi:hypothetical protein